MNGFDFCFNESKTMLKFWFLQFWSYNIIDSLAEVFMPQPPSEGMVT